MQAGTLRRPITIQSATTAADGAGGYTMSWATFNSPTSQPGGTSGQTFGSLRMLNGRELADAQQYDARVNALIATRWQNGLSPKLRVTVAGPDVTRTFEVHAVLNVDDRYREAWLYCEELLTQ